MWIFSFQARKGSYARKFSIGHDSIFVNFFKAKIESSAKLIALTKNLNRSLTKSKKKVSKQYKVYVKIRTRKTDTQIND